MIPLADTSPDLTALERAVLDTAFSSVGTAAAFRDQIEAATVDRRSPSGVGFVTKLKIPEACQVAGAAVDGSSLVVAGEHPALPSGAEFILQVKNGRIHCIEAYCFEGMWPADESQFRVHAGP